MRKFKQKICSLVVTTTICTGLMLFVPIVVSASTEEQFRLGFEDFVDNTNPQNQGNVAFDLKTVTGATYVKSNGIYGKDIGDSALKITASGGSGGNRQGQLETTFSPAITPKVGGKVVVSWEMAQSSLTAKSFVAASIKYKDSTGTEFDSNINHGNAEYFQFATNVTYGGSPTRERFMWMGGVNPYWAPYQYVWQPEAWYRFDMAFYEGSNKAVLYVNGYEVLSTTFNTNGNPVSKFVGLNKLYIGAGSSGTTYVDNYSVKVLDASDVVVPSSFNETFDGFKGTNKYVYYYGWASNMAQSDKYYQAVPVTGKFGKSANDVSMNIRVNNRLDGTGVADKSNPYVYMDAGVVKEPLRYGEKVSVGLNFALTSADLKGSRRGITLLSRTNKNFPSTANDGLGVVATISEGNLSLHNDKIKTAQNWVAGKWYHLEFVFEPGNGSTIKNKYSVYLDGKQTASNIEFDADKNIAYSAIDGFGQMRLNYFLDAPLSGLTNARLQNEFLIDDITFKNQPLSYIPSNVTITSNDNGININYANILLLNSEMTLENLKSKITLSGADVVKYINNVGTSILDSDSVINSYISVKSPQGSVYYYYITDKILFYKEDFSAYKPLTDYNYNGMPIIKQASAGAMVGGKGETALGAKAADDNSYLITYNNWSYNTYDVPEGQKTNGSFLHWEYGGIKGAGTLAPLTMEFSMLSDGEDYAAKTVAFDYLYKQNGETKTNGIFNLVTMDDGYISIINSNFKKPYKIGQWHKVALIIDPQTITGDFYIDGELAAKNINLYSQTRTNAVMEGVFRLKVATHFPNINRNEIHTGAFGFDDYSIYAGQYKPSEDSITVSSKNAAISVNNGYISIDDSVDYNTFVNALQINGGKEVKYYMDNSFTAPVDPILGFFHDNYAIINTKSGTIHYLRIVDINQPTNISKAPKLYQNIESILIPTYDGYDYSLGDYVVTSQMDKYSTVPEKCTMLVAQYDGNKLVDIQLQEIDLKVGINDLSCNSVLKDFYKTGCFKTFVWGGISNLKPIMNTVPTWTYK